jgi:hypothetical protein
MKRLVVAVAVVRLLTMAWDAAAQPLTLTPLGTFDAGAFRTGDPRISEINAYDPVGQRIYVVNPQAGRVDVINASNPASLVSGGAVNFVADCAAVQTSGCPVAGSEPNSVAIFGNLMGIAISNAVRTDNGHAVFYRLQGAAQPQFLASIEAGAVPDAITFTEDGQYALTANEGEPNQAYTIDPPGSVSIIDVSRIGGSGAVRHVFFDRYDNPGQRKQLERGGVRIFGPGASPSQDLEPEYIATDKNKAYVTLQENNAMAIINIRSATLESVVGLGLKDHSLPGNTLDTNDQDGAANLVSRPVFGMYQPDAIAAIPGNGRTFLIMANEGDARDYDGFSEESRVSGGSSATNPNGNYPLDPGVFPDQLTTKTAAQVGRLNVTTATGDLDGDGDFDRIELFGARSVSVRDQNGALVWDSGDMFEQLTKSLDAQGKTVFNTSNSNNTRDNRSDDKGPEPESVVVGEVNGTPYAFVGLERDGGIVVLNLADPTSPKYVTYATNRAFPGGFSSCNEATNNCGGLGPEGLTFVHADNSPTGKALLIVSYEVSSTTTVWEID